MADKKPSSTIPLTSRRQVSSSAHAMYLARIGQAHRPLQPQARVYELRELDELQLNRGSEEMLALRGTARIQVDDGAMSKRHARLKRSGEDGAAHFVIEDSGSVNGTHVNGVRVDAPLAVVHGDVIETGHTFWRYFDAHIERPEVVLDSAFSGGEPSMLDSVSPLFLEAADRLRRVAPSDIPLIVGGETGAGKEVVAGEIHRLSAREGRFVAVNCAAIPEGLIESELFGHRKGAFTGAVADKEGVVERADGGTLLLDETGDLSLPAQAKLLRLLQERSFTRVGETRERHVHVRFVAATHRDLSEMVARGTFRGDLYARLNGLHLRLPALRERKEDIGLFLCRFLRQAGADARVQLAPEAYLGLLLHEWPFNVRELLRAVETALALRTNQDVLAPAHFPKPVRDALDAAMSRAVGKDAESEAEGDAAPTVSEDSSNTAWAAARETDEGARAFIIATLDKTEGNVTAAARELGVSRTQIHRWLRRLEIKPESFRP